MYVQIDVQIYRYTAISIYLYTDRYMYSQIDRQIYLHTCFDCDYTCSLEPADIDGDIDRQIERQIYLHTLTVLTATRLVPWNPQISSASAFHTCEKILIIISKLHMYMTMSAKNISFLDGSPKSFLPFIFKIIGNKDDQRPLEV